MTDTQTALDRIYNWMAEFESGPVGAGGRTMIDKTTLETQLVRYSRSRPEGFTAKEAAVALGGKRPRHVAALMNNVRKDSAYRVKFVTLCTLATREKVYGLSYKDQHVAVG